MCSLSADSSSIATDGIETAVERQKKDIAKAKISTYP